MKKDLKIKGYKNIKHIIKKDLEILTVFDLLFESQVVFIKGKEKEVSNYLKKNKLYIENINFSYTWTKGKKSTIYINKNVRKKDINKVLIHEIIHAVQENLDNVGITSGVENTEILAYITDYFF